MSPELRDLVYALSTLLLTAATTLLPVLAAYIIRKYKLEGDIAKAQKIEAGAMDLAMSIEEWAATMKRTGQVVSSYDKLSRFVNQATKQLKLKNTDQAVDLLNSTMVKLKMGSHQKPAETSEAK